MESRTAIGLSECETGGDKHMTDKRASTLSTRPEPNTGCSTNKIR